VPYAALLAAVFDRNAEPHVTRPPFCAIPSAQKIAHQRGPLREHLKCVPVSALHSVTHARDKLVRDFFMEQITHRVNEDHTRLAPAQRLFETLRTQRQIKAVFKRMASGSTKAFRETLGIAMVAPGADFRAARYRIPRRIRPFYRGRICHVLP